MGLYSIRDISWNGQKVYATVPITNFLSFDTLWRPEIQCILPSKLTVSLESTVYQVGFKVTILGKLEVNSRGVPKASILFSSSVTKGESWSDISLMETDDSGKVSVVWLPSATGNYILKAVWPGNNSYPATESTSNLAVLPFDDTNVFAVTSNSTLSTIVYDSVNRKFSFTVTGPEETMGYSTAIVAKSIVGDVGNIEVYISDDPIDYSVSSKEDSWLVYFTYPHSTHSVSIQLGSAAIFGISLEITLVIIIVIIALASLGLVYFIKKRQKTSTN